MQKIKSQTRI